MGSNLVPVWSAKLYYLSPVRLRRVASDHALSDASQLLLADLCYADGPMVGGRRKGYVWAGVATMARWRGWSVRKVAYCIAELVRAGLIARVQRGRGRSALTVICWAAICPEVDRDEVCNVQQANRRCPARVGRGIDSDRETGKGSKESGARPPRLERGARGRRPRERTAAVGVTREPPSPEMLAAMAAAREAILGYGAA